MVLDLLLFFCWDFKDTAAEMYLCPVTEAKGGTLSSNTSFCPVA